jgi:hypothetical protein
MTTNEYIHFVLEHKKETAASNAVNEAAARETAQLISGSFIYSLFEALWVEDFDIESITQHIESLYDSGNHFGLVYFVFMLANAADFVVPKQFTEMSATDALVPFLSAAIIEDWLEYQATCEATEIE